VLGSDGQLYLLRADTTAGLEIYTAWPYPQLRQAMLESPARNKVLILDCCFAGRALDWLSVGAGLGQLDIAGTYVLTATSANRPAYVARGARHSAFTGALLDVLTLGVPGGGELIRVDELHPLLHRTLLGRGLPEPRQMQSDRIGNLALVRNPAWPGA
jgi:hypothetical protein